MEQNSKPFIHFEKVDNINIVFASIYAIITAAICFSCNNYLPEKMPTLLSSYAILTQMAFYLFLGKPLQNFSVYAIWLGFSLVHLLMYYFFGGNPYPKNITGDPSKYLTSTIILLLLFQILRYYSLIIQKREFLVLEKSNPKRFSLTDRLVFVIYMICFGGLVYYHGTHI